tara:strand:+ start:544 stop:675 length:132 start_codon:yes stop_codon:yes gene_type:complete
MAHEQDPLNPLSEKATMAQVIAEINEIIERINHMWYPEDHTEE